MHLIRYHVEYTYITVYRNDDKIYLSAKQTYIFPCFSQLVRSCSNTMININQTDYWCNLNAIAESAEAVLLQPDPGPDITD